MEDCPPQMQQMNREVIVEPMRWTVRSIADEPTRRVESNYVVSIQNRTERAKYVIESEGTVSMTSRLPQLVKIKYRTTFEPPFPWRLTGAASEAVCLEDESVTLLIVEDPVRPSETILTAFYWTAEVVRSTDINQDGVVDGADIGLLMVDYGTSAPRSDLNRDNAVDSSDLGLLLSDFGS